MASREILSTYLASPDGFLAQTTDLSVNVTLWSLSWLAVWLMKEKAKYIYSADLVVHDHPFLPS